MQFVPFGNRKTTVCISSFWHKHFLMSNKASLVVCELFKNISAVSSVGTDLLSRQFETLACKEKFYI